MGFVTDKPWKVQRLCNFEVLQRDGLFCVNRQFQRVNLVAALRPTRPGNKLSAELLRSPTDTTLRQTE